MSEKPADPGLASSAVPRAVGLLGLYATYVAAALFVVVIAGDAAALVRRLPVAGWLALLVGMGPLVALLLSTVASYVNYYGVWRVVRGRDEYDVAQDLKSHAADAPQAAQALLAGRSGCLPAVSTGLLVLSLALTVASSVPPQTPFIGALGAWGGRQGAFALSSDPATPTVTAATAAPTVSPTVAATPGATATPAPVVIGFSVGPTQAEWDCATQGVTPAAPTVTLDNYGSNVAIAWQATAQEKDGTGALWAAIRPASGKVPATGTQTITITPNPQAPAELCRSSSPNGTAWHISIVAEGVGTYTFMYTVYA